jgi:hypothetical protein
MINKKSWFMNMNLNKIIIKIIIHFIYPNRIHTGSAIKTLSLWALKFVLMENIKTNIISSQNMVIYSLFIHSMQNLKKSLKYNNKFKTTFKLKAIKELSPYTIKKTLYTPITPIANLTILYSIKK